MVVLNADGERDGAEGGGNGGGVRGIDGDDLMRARVVRGAGGDAEQIFVCHSKKKIDEIFRDRVGISIPLAVLFTWEEDWHASHIYSCTARVSDDVGRR